MSSVGTATGRAGGGQSSLNAHDRSSVGSRPRVSGGFPSDFSCGDSARSGAGVVCLSLSAGGPGVDSQPVSPRRHLLSLGFKTVWSGARIQEGKFSRRKEWPARPRFPRRSCLPLSRAGDQGERDAPANTQGRACLILRAPSLVILYSISIANLGASRSTL